jgi:hypothetical protein
MVFHRHPAKNFPIGFPNFAAAIALSRRKHFADFQAPPRPAYDLNSAQIPLRCRGRKATYGPQGSNSNKMLPEHPAFTPVIQLDTKKAQNTKSETRNKSKNKQFSKISEGFGHLSFQFRICLVLRTLYFVLNAPRYL